MLTNYYHQEIDRYRQSELRDSLHAQQLADVVRSPRSFRRAIGHSMIRIGRRLAADPARQRARLA